MADISVFDTFERAEIGRKLRAEPVFDYLNRSAEDPARRVRNKIEAWFASFPPDGQADIRGRLRSGEPTAFDSAFHELVLHAVLTSLGLTAELHPTLAHSPKNPDFLVHGDSVGDLFLEAVAPTDVSDACARQRAATLLDGLDAKLGNPNYWLSITVEQYSKQTGSAKRFRRFVDESLSQLPTAPIKTPTGLADELEPRRFEYREDGWVIEIAGFPKAQSLRSTTGAIGMEFSSFEEIIVYKRLRNALETKAKKYGPLTLPYVIAVNTNDIFSDELEILMALFGYGAAPTRKGTPPSLGAQPYDGLWMKAERRRNTQVSAVLFTTKVSPANLGAATAKVYLNPWATRPYTGTLTHLPSAVFTQDAAGYEITPGRSLLEVLGIEPGWPSWPTECETEPLP